MPRRSAASTDTPLDAPPVRAEYRVVSLGLVHPSPLNPRRGRDTPDDERALAELAASIKQHGILEPLVVRPSKTLGAFEEAFELVAGHRRWRAADTAGLTEVPVTIHDVTDAELVALALAENLHRASMPPLDEAHALDRLRELDRAYQDVGALARKIGRSESHVRDRLRLLRLGASVETALALDAITASHAERIARLPAAQHAAALEACFSRILLLADESDEHVQALEDAVDRHRGDFIPALIDASRFDLLAPALQSVRELDRWIATHGKLDVTDPEVRQQAFSALDNPPPPDAEEEIVASLVQLSAADDYSFTTSHAKRIEVLHSSKWREVAPDSPPCKYVKRGVIAHGGDPRILDFCASARCAAHWPEKQTTSSTTKGKGKKGKAAKKPAWQVKQEREAAEREAQQAAWEPLRAAAIEAIVKHALGLKPTLVVARTLTAEWSTELEPVDKTAKAVGLKPTDRNAFALIVLASCAIHNWDERAEFERDAKRLGFDVAKWETQHAKAAAAAPPAKRGRKGKAR